MQLERLFLEYDWPLTWIPDADEELNSQTIDVEVETPATTVAGFKSLKTLFQNLVSRRTSANGLLRALQF